MVFELTYRVGEGHQNNSKDEDEPPASMLEVWEMTQQQNDQVKGQTVDQISEAPVNGPPLWKPVNLLDEILIKMILVEWEAEPAEEDEADDQVESPTFQPQLVPGDVDDDDDETEEKECNDAAPDGQKDNVNSLQLIGNGRI